MFAHFEIIGVMLGVEDHEEKYGFTVVRVLTEWERDDTSSQYRNILRCLVRHEYVKIQLATCRRGDLIIMYGNIHAKPDPKLGDNIWPTLQVGKIQRLISGYAHHASGKCEKGLGKTTQQKNAMPEKEFARS